MELVDRFRKIMQEGHLLQRVDRHDPVELVDRVRQILQEGHLFLRVAPIGLDLVELEYCLIGE